MSLCLFTCFTFEHHSGVNVTATYREFQLILFVSGNKWPPALDPLLFKNGDYGHLSFIRHHLNGALLGSFCTTRETVQVQLNRPYEKYYLTELKTVLNQIFVRKK